MESKSSLSVQVGSCSTYFGRLCDFVSARRPADNEHATLAVESQRRFSLWSRSLGAQRSGKSSLDYRLKDAPRARAAVGSFINELQTSLRKAMLLLDHGATWDMEATGTLIRGSLDSTAPAAAPATSESDAPHNPSSKGDAEILDELWSCFDDFKEIIDCLFRICVNLQAHAAKRDVSEKSDQIDVSSFTIYDEEHVSGKFPNATPELSRRLTSAMAKRRQFLKYREDHAARLARDQPGVDLGPGDTRTVFSETTASGYVDSSVQDQNKLEDQPLVRQDDAISVFSDTTYATMADLGRLVLPSLPEGAEDGQFFMCPCCKRMQQLPPIGTRRAWMKHVFTDLKPYLCTFESCKVSDRMFDSRHAWFAHELKQHRQVWYCVGHCGLRFDSHETFVKHAQSAGLVSSMQSDAFADMCKRSMDPNEDLTCPLCQNVITGAKRFAKHLGRHMEETALFSLPISAFDAADDDQFESDSTEEEIQEPQEERKPSKNFGVSLDTIFNRDNTAVPLLVLQCIQAVDQYGLGVKNIYISSGNVARTRRLRDALDNDGLAINLRNPESFEHDITSVAALLKQFFRELPEPLFTTQYYKRFIEAARLEDDVTRRDSTHALINELPDPNYATLRALALHLGRVALRSSENQMSIPKLAICFAPTLMGQHQGENLVDAGLQAHVIDTILMNVYQIFDED